MASARALQKWLAEVRFKFPLELYSYKQQIVTKIVTSLLVTRIFNRLLKFVWPDKTQVFGKF